jgi:hypothetical protein
MVMVEYFANSPTGALGDFARALGGADADVLAGDSCTLADIARGIDGMKCNKVGRTFPDPLGRRTSALGSSFADVSGATADLTPGAALMRLPLGRRLRSVGGLRRRLGLAVLTASVLAAEDKCEYQEGSG